VSQQLVLYSSCFRTCIKFSSSSDRRVVKSGGCLEVENLGSGLTDEEAEVLASHASSADLVLVNSVDNVPELVVNGVVVLTLEETFNRHIDDRVGEIGVASIRVDTALVLNGLLLDEARNLVVGQRNEPVRDLVEGIECVNARISKGILRRLPDVIDTCDNLATLLDARSIRMFPSQKQTVSRSLDEMEEVRRVLLEARDQSVGLVDAEGGDECDG